MPISIADNGTAGFNSTERIRSIKERLAKRGGNAGRLTANSPLGNLQLIKQHLRNPFYDASPQKKNFLQSQIAEYAVEFWLALFPEGWVTEENYWHLGKPNDGKTMYGSLNTGRIFCEFGENG